MNLLIRSVALAAGLCAVAVGAHAEEFILNFSASGFVDQVPGNTYLPPNGFSGSIDFSAAARGSAVTSINSVNMTIGLYSYTVAAVGVDTSFTPEYFFGGTINTVDSMTYGTNDFFLDIDPSDYTHGEIVFTTPSPADDTAWEADSYGSGTFVSSITPVPEPETCALMLLGLVAVGYAARRRARH